MRASGVTMCGTSNSISVRRTFYKVHLHKGSARGFPGGPFTIGLTDGTGILNVPGRGH